MELDPELTKNWLDFEQFKEKYQKVPVEEFPNNVLRAVSEPMVSVHIITYQHADYIRDAIEGVLMQKTDFPFEIIIGDDESTDGTREICMEYAEKYPDLIRLLLHKRENNIAILGKPSHIFQYAYNSFNLRGKYVAVCSGDDYWTDPQKLQKQVEFMEGNEGYSLCYHNVIEKSREGNLETKKEGFPVPCTLLALNIFNRLPEEFFHAINEDNFMNQILEFYGERKYLEKVKPSIRRVHIDSIWSRHKNGIKLDYKLNTQYQIFKAFQETKIKKRLAIAYLKTLYGKSKLVNKNRWLFIYIEAINKRMFWYLIPMFISMLKGKYF